MVTNIKDKIKPSRFLLVVAIFGCILLWVFALLELLVLRSTMSYLAGIVSGGFIVYIFCKFEQLGIKWDDKVRFIKVVKFIDLVKNVEDEKK